MKRRRARENPTTGTWLAIGGGAALLGVAAYFMFRKPAATTTTTPALTAAAAAPTGGATRPLGDPADPNSVAYACEMAYKLANAHPSTAGARKLRATNWAYYNAKCTAGGGIASAQV
jgi:hypothetical protein